jgi:AAA+ ATPase superfamily predicted ATPase
MNNQFINRKRELEFLQALYAREQAQLAVVYGRRRLGKTTLLRQFTTGSPTV